MADRVALRAGAAYFAVVFAAGFVLGMVRVLVLLPRLGEAVAVAVEIPVMLSLCWVAARWLVARFAVAPRLGPRLIMGGVAFALLMLAEAAVSVLVLGRGLAEHLGYYRAVPGLMGLAGQVASALFPAIQLSAGGPRNP
jgi:hypothetical protein